LHDTLGYLPQANDEPVKAFAIRQLRARQRLPFLLEFYRQNHCRLARLQLLAACAIALRRLAGYSKSFDELGDAFMPFDWAHTLKINERNTAHGFSCSAVAHEFRVRNLDRAYDGCYFDATSVKSNKII
jgi:hypothetical protein